jgi:hypothetical protein
MSCPTGQIIAACDFPQFFVDQTPKFDELIMQDIRPTDGWLGNFSMGTLPPGTPAEVTQDRFRSVWPNTTKVWNRVQANGPGCVGSPCDPTENEIGWGADRLTWYAEQQVWQTPLLCYDQDMHVTNAEQHINQIVNEILKPATSAISSNFLRKRTILWSKGKNTANSTLTQFTYTWTLAGAAGDEEQFFDCSVAPTNTFHLVPQMLQNRFSPLMRRGYAGKNPFKETAPFIELVTDMDTAWFLDKLGGQVGVGPSNTPSTAGNWRFTEWGAANQYWRYGFSGQIGNFLVRVDELNLRFNFVRDLGASVGANRYRYQVVLPFKNGVTTGAGGAAGIGSNENPDYDRAQFTITFISHKDGLELMTMDGTPTNAETPFLHRDFGGKWMFQMHDLGADANGNVIKNAWGNKGRFASWFKYYIRPKHYEFLEVFFHKREQFCIPQIDVCSASPGYPAQNYSSKLPICPAPSATYGTGVPTGGQDGPIA